MTVHIGEKINKNKMGTLIKRQIPRRYFSIGILLIVVTQNFTISAYFHAIGEKEKKELSKKY